VHAFIAMFLARMGHSGSRRTRALTAANSRLAIEQQSRNYGVGSHTASQISASSPWQTLSRVVCITLTNDFPCLCRVTRRSPVACRALVPPPCINTPPSAALIDKPPMLRPLVSLLLCWPKLLLELVWRRILGGDMGSVCAIESCARSSA